MTRRDDAYSALKAVRHLDIVRDVRAGVPARPAHVQLILSDLCNQACGFCFLPGALVLTSEGFVPIEQVQEGDDVFDRHGRWLKVTHAMQRPFEGDVAKITLQKYAPGLTCTSNHRLDVVRDGRRDWLNAEQLRPGDYLVVPLPKEATSVNSIDAAGVLDGLEIDGDRCRLPRGRVWMRRNIPVDRDFGRLLGYYLGDGHATFPKTRPGSGLVVMSINAEDQWVQDEIRRLVKDVLWLDAGYAVAPTSVHVSINSTVAARLIEVLCGVDAYSKQLHPALLLNASSAFLEGVFEGYARTDGCISDQSFSSINQKLVMGVFFASLRLGLSPSVFRSKARGSQIDGRAIEPGAPPFTVRYRGDSGKTYARIVGAPARTAASDSSGRAEVVFPRADDAVLVKVKGVEFERVASTVHNLEVEDSHSYTVNLLAVANCAYRDPTYSSSQRFFEIKPAGAGLRRDAEHPERNYNPNRMIPTAKALEIVDDCAEMGVSGIQNTGGGEPTVHPDFIQILRYQQQKGLATSLVTNGVVVGKKLLAGDPEWRGALLGLSWIRFSLDAGRAETYQRIRNVPDWHFPAALGGIGRLAEERARIGKAGDNPVIGVGFVVTPDNWREVALAASLARDLGADNIRISAQFSAEDEALFAGFHEECAALCREAEGFSVPGGFTTYNRFGQKLDDLRQRAPDYDKCGYQHFTTYVGADLTVYRCCVLAYNDAGAVGSIKDRRFRDLWMSQERADEMAAFSARGCDRCQFNGINRNLEYLLDKDDPEHSEFV